MALTRKSERITSELIRYLSDDPEVTGPFFTSEEEIRAAWEEHRTMIIAAHTKTMPGTRPRHWWEFDAPEPRRRVGGTGTSSHEVNATALWLHFGIPVDWVALGDPNDPPIFESQAAFLQRLNLLIPGEEKRLTESDFQPVTLSEALATFDNYDEPS